MTPVLAILDPDITAAQPALDKASRLARAYGAPIAVYVNPYSSSLLRGAEGDAEAITRLIDHTLARWQARIEALLDALDAPDSDTHLFFEADDAASLEALIVRLQPSLTVVHTDHVEGVRRLLLTPRHWHLLREAPCPVLCVSPSPWDETMQVTVAVDTEHSRGKPESLDRKLVESGRNLASHLQARLKVVNVVEYPDETLIMLAGDALPVSLSSTANLREYYQRRLDLFCEQTRFAAEDSLLLEGAPHKALAEYFNEHHGVLVLGSIERGAVRRLLLGNTAEKVLQHSHADVLVVKPDGFQSPWQEA